MTGMKAACRCHIRRPRFSAENRRYTRYLLHPNQDWADCFPTEKIVKKVQPQELPRNKINIASLFSFLLHLIEGVITPRFNFLNLENLCHVPGNGGNPKRRTTG